jgi:hypothetical protein
VQSVLVTEKSNFTTECRGVIIIINLKINSKLNIMYPSTDEILIVYQYTRGDVVFTTPNKLIAVMRSENGSFKIKKYFYYH